MKNSKSTLKNKAVTGMLWSVSDLIANQGLQFVIQIFLARLVLPEEFGIIGMVTIFLALSESIVDSGFANALIREKKVSQKDYSTVFYFNLAVALGLYALLFASSGAISRYFNEPQLVNIIKVIGVVVIINAFGLIPTTILIKKIDFKTQTRISVISAVVSGVAGISAAFMGFGVWSLVIKTLTMQTMRSILLMVFNQWKPSLVFSKTSLKKLFGFGWKLLVSGLINTLYVNIYYVIIGRRFSAVSLGYYTNAQRLRDTISQSVTMSIQKVSFPVFSEIQDDEMLFRESVRKVIRSAAFLMFPVMIGLAAVAPKLIGVLFGQRWMASVAFFQVLCLAGMLLPFHAINLNVLQVKGRSDLFLGIEVAKKVIGVSMIVGVLFLKLGIWGLLWTAVINSIIAYFINAMFSKKVLGYSTLEQLKDIVPTFLVSGIMGILVYVLGMTIQSFDLVVLILQMIAGAGLYVGLCKLTKIEELQTTYDLIRSFVGGRNVE